MVRESFGSEDQFSIEFWSGGPIFHEEFWSARSIISMKNASQFQNNLERMSSPSCAAVAVIRSSIIVAICRQSIGREFRF